VVVWFQEDVEVAVAVDIAGVAADIEL